MVTQKLISFKIDINQLEQLDNICSLTGLNRNKLINYCLSFGISVMNMQLNVALRTHKDVKSIYFLEDI